MIALFKSLDSTIAVEWADLLKGEILYQAGELRKRGKNPVRVYVNARDYRALMGSVNWCGRFDGLWIELDPWFENPKVAYGMTVR
jgi:hypothetical protein